ncbi:hypothetical protein G4177_06025 [Corallococcus sp. ZKHCc1 1396]|uniref:Uncharacterized protein n=1 Tax=Corallococcus soli TaxID=2710757 RepID=A0ABR9PIJ1_9BACT|nr:hypothetical protein [Corallococcus soli]MBE4747735.1 hypothetical protein [Corallococcus soli]
MGSAAATVVAPAIRERPILFSAAMILALLAGRKTVTRRLLKPQPAPNAPHDGGTVWEFRPDKGLHVPCGTVGHLSVAEKMGLRCPYGQPGDRLWVRETFHITSANEVVYRADYPYNATERGMENIPAEQAVRWCPSIHMPRWASRLTLKVLSVRAERLHDITEEDAKHEGVEEAPDPFDEDTEYWRCFLPECADDCAGVLSARESFETLWKSINGPESWDANPWVWRVEIARVTP